MSGKKNGNLFAAASGRDLEVSSEEKAKTPPGQQEDTPPNVEMLDTAEVSELSERRKALFEPLEPIKNINGRRPSAESLLPPPDFESANYPKGWLIGKKRKLVNVDVVEKMRRIAVQEMNRKVILYSKFPLRVLITQSNCLFSIFRMKLRLLHLTTFVTGQGNRRTKRTTRGGFAVS